MQKLFVMLCALALGGCLVGRTQVENVSGVGVGEVLLVGRIELVPPLDPKEQQLNSVNTQLRGKAHAIIADKWFDLDDPSFSTYSSAAIIDLGKDFYVSQARAKTLFYSGSLIQLRAITRATGRRSAAFDQEEIRLPGGIKYNIGPTDRAVYLGTIRYHRDVYNAITDVEFIDDFERANRDYRQRFGEQFRLRHALPQKVREERASSEESVSG